jgi:hypothetical protein
MVTAVALVALTSSISIGMAEAHPWGWHGGWGYHYWDRVITVTGTFRISGRDAT